MHKNKLWTQKDLNDSLGSLEEWAQKAYHDYVKVISNPKFPCFFAALGLEKGGYQYCFADSVKTNESKMHITNALISYLESLKGVDPEEEKWRILITFIKTESASLEQDNRDFWELLQYFHDSDQRPWPEKIPTSIDHEKWAFCFGGREVFINASSSHLAHRKSRNLGSSLTLVIQPREVFDLFELSTKERIRKRIEVFDSMPVKPIFLTGKAHKKHTYFATDKNEDDFMDCPFVFRKNKAEEKILDLER